MTVREMLEQAISNHKIMISEFKQYTRAADKQDDPGTSDLFIRFVQVHEKQLWFLSEFLERRDGLVS